MLWHGGEASTHHKHRTHTHRLTGNHMASFGWSVGRSVGLWLWHTNTSTQYAFYVAQQLLPLQSELLLPRQKCRVCSDSVHVHVGQDQQCVPSALCSSLVCLVVRRWFGLKKFTINTQLSHPRQTCFFLCVRVCVASVFVCVYVWMCIVLYDPLFADVSVSNSFCTLREFRFANVATRASPPR